MKNSIYAKKDSPPLIDGSCKRVVACGIGIFLAAARHGKKKQPQSMDSYLKESSNAGKEPSRLMPGGPEMTAGDSVSDRMS
jgi:protein tyrosine/serine phosphatase